MTQIISILESVSLGYHYFPIAMLLRESLLINSMLSSVEVWYSLKYKDICELTSVDKILLSNLLTGKKSNPEEGYYLELGIMPFSVIIKAKRIKYLYYLLTRDKQSMLYNFFWEQWRNPYKEDWTNQVRKDLTDLKIPSDFDWIVSKSKQWFKHYVNQKAQAFAFEILKIKQNSHSKINKIQYSRLKIQPYMTDEKIPVRTKRLLFNFRMRMLNFGENFRGARPSVPCPFACPMARDSETHLFLCSSVNKEEVGKVRREDFLHEDISAENISILEKLLKQRDSLLEQTIPSYNAYG